MNEADTKRRAERLIYTSVDDCKSSLPHYDADDLPALRKALMMAERAGHTTRAKVIKTRIRQVEKEMSAPSGNGGHEWCGTGRK
jgi:hypothetical protein